MKHFGLSQKDFATALHQSEGTLSSIFTGRTNPSNKIVNAIHESYPNVSITWLMFGEGEMLTDAHSSSGQDAGVVQHSSGNDARTPIPDSLFDLPASPQIHEVVKYVDKPQRKISEIRVFYDDGTFETFSA